MLLTVDDKMELNRRINENLELQLELYFNKIFYENADSERCENVPLGQLVSVIDNRGKTPPTSLTKTDFPLIDVKALSSSNTKTNSSRIINYDDITKYVSKNTYNEWFRNGHPKEQDILMSTVGNLAEMKILWGNKGCIAQNVVAFRSKNISPLYLYQYLKHIKNTLKLYDIGSVQSSINVSHIIGHKICLPPEKQILMFHSVALAMTNKIFLNTEENKKLYNIHGLLLKKLMTGNLDVSKIKIQL